MKRLLVNDVRSCIPGTLTFWDDLIEWFGCEFVGARYDVLADVADTVGRDASLIIRNATYFGPLESSKTVPTISLLQDIITEGPGREMQEEVIKSSHTVVYNSAFTASKYKARFKKHDGPSDADVAIALRDRIIPLPVDFSLFEPGNAMGLQQALSLPSGCVCWIGASQEPAASIKGWDIFLKIVRTNPDLNFVAVFKDAMPGYAPPNLRMFVKLTHKELVKVIGACRVGLCTSRVESQHLAGIEMGACGLTIVAPPVGCYFNRKDITGILVNESTPEQFTGAIRHCLSMLSDPLKVREYWRKEFDKPVIRAAWEKLINEVESLAIEHGLSAVADRATDLGRPNLSTTFRKGD